MMPGHTLSESSFSHIVNAPIESIDLADWLFHLSNAEFRRCYPPAHFACGTTTTDDGRPMSINVEHIGESLVIQQYIGEITEPRHCRMVSTSDVFTSRGQTTAHIVWDLSVEKIDDHACEYINHLAASATDHLLATISDWGISFDQAAARCDRASVAHNQQETPQFAASIARRALA
jgi:hypothetical protein